MIAPVGEKKFCTELKFPEPVPVGVARIGVAEATKGVEEPVAPEAPGGLGAGSLGGVENVFVRGAALSVAPAAAGGVEFKLFLESAFCIIIIAAGSITDARLSRGLSDWATRTKSSPAATSSQTKSIGKAVGTHSFSPRPAILAHWENTFSPAAYTIPSADVVDIRSQKRSRRIEK